MSRLPEQADVVVIGGGPAGSTAANLLAQRGYDVVLVEQVKHPRNVVGESLIPHFWKYLDQLGATDDIMNQGFIVKTGGTAIWQGKIRQLRIRDFGHSRPSLHVERDEYDEILLRVAERKGVKVFEEVSARAVQFGDERGVTCLDRVSNETSYIKCKYVIDASGQGAVIARQLGIREFDKDLRFMSVWAYFDNSSYVAQGGLICPWEKRREISPTTVQAGIGDWGWCWHIVQKEHTSLGLVLAPSQQAEFKSTADNLEDRILNACRKLPIIGGLLADATIVPDSALAIRDFAYRPTQLAGEGWFLTGDAAAFVDPINSAGVVTAFYTGAAAAWSVDSSLKKPARANYFAEIFSTLVRQRLTLFRISALPAGHNTYPEDYPIAVGAARMDSSDERELIAAQTIITARHSNLEPLTALDPTLTFESNKWAEVEELHHLEADLQPAVAHIP